MELDADDLKTVATAKRNERFWKYWRVVELLFGLGIIGLSFWLIENPEFPDDGLRRYLIPALAGTGGAVLGGLILSWTNNQRQLLIRLASSVSPSID
jgi:hypothetical protein